MKTSKHFTAIEKKKALKPSLRDESAASLFFRKASLRHPFISSVNIESNALRVISHESGMRVLQRLVNRDGRNHCTHPSQDNEASPIDHRAIVRYTASRLSHISRDSAKAA